MTLTRTAKQHLARPPAKGLVRLVRSRPPHRATPCRQTRWVRRPSSRNQPTIEKNSKVGRRARDLYRFRRRIVVVSFQIDGGVHATRHHEPREVVVRAEPRAGAQPHALPSAKETQSSINLSLPKPSLKHVAASVPLSARTVWCACSAPPNARVCVCARSGPGPPRDPL